MRSKNSKKKLCNWKQRNSLNPKDTDKQSRSEN